MPTTHTIFDPMCTTNTNDGPSSFSAFLPDSYHNHNHNHNHHHQDENNDNMTDVHRISQSNSPPSLPTIFNQHHPHPHQMYQVG